GMALNGRKILLIDANFRKPGVHKVFGFECGGQGVGLSACLEDVNYFDTAVQDTNVPNLSVLVAGDQPANPTELIEGANFTDVLDRALEEYDHVIFDSGPILFVSETGALAPQMDGVVSVVSAKGSSRGMLGRLRDTLRSMNVEHLGVVLNSVRAQAGGYYNRNMKTYYDYKRDGQLMRQ
ncbi:MAG: CpsD/CapB family tyrosine-protein kinase, partial [Planctomycetota bacterium]